MLYRQDPPVIFGFREEMINYTKVEARWNLEFEPTNYLRTAGPNLLGNGACFQVESVDRLAPQGA